MSCPRQESADQLAILRHIVDRQNDARCLGFGERGTVRGWHFQRDLGTVYGGQNRGQGLFECRMQQRDIFVQHFSVAPDRANQVQQIVIHITGGRSQ